MDGSVAAGGGLSPSVSATLDVLAAEIELAGARCIFLDRVIGEVMDGLADEQRSRLVEGLHAVDLLAQHLTSLSAFARSMSFVTPVDIAAPADAALAERMRASLGGADDDEPDAGHDSGDLDLF